jgi:hypothetical protein
MIDDADKRPCSIAATSLSVLVDTQKPTLDLPIIPVYKIMERE